MEVFGKDMRIGETFLLSSLGQMLGSFSASGEENAEIGYNNETIEEFLGDDPVPVYLGSKYNGKLELEIEILKNPCVPHYSPFFTQHELREVLRYLTGYQYYKELQILDYEVSEDEQLYYLVRFTSVSYEKVGNRVVGIVQQGECDSMFAYTKEYTNTYVFGTPTGMSENPNIVIYNTSDDLYNYLLPKVVIEPTIPGDIVIENQSDNNRKTIVHNVLRNEIVTMDSKNKILTSSNSSRVILNDFNMNWLRQVPGRNVLQCKWFTTYTFTYRLPRKVGIDK